MSKLEDLKSIIKQIFHNDAFSAKKSMKEIIPRLDLRESITTIIESLTDDEIEKITIQLVVDQKIPQQEEPKQELQKNNNLILIPEDLKPQGELALNSSEKIDQYIQVMEKVQSYAIHLIKQLPADAFVIFGKNVCFTSKAVYQFFSKIPLPLEIKDVYEFPPIKDEEGYSIFRYSANCRNTITGMAMPIYSEESSGKAFYKTRYVNGKKTILLPDQVNIRDVRVAAYHGLYKDAFKLFFGMKGLTVDEAKNIGINVQQIKIAK